MSEPVRWTEAGSIQGSIALRVIIVTQRSWCFKQSDWFAISEKLSIIHSLRSEQYVIEQIFRPTYIVCKSRLRVITNFGEKQERAKYTCRARVEAHTSLALLVLPVSRACACILLGSLSPKLEITRSLL